MTRADGVQVVLVATLCAVVVGGVGLGVGYLLRRRSLRWQLGLVALVAVAASWTGVFAVAHEMLISDHDFAVVSVVSTAAGLIALLVALALGRAVARWSESLRAEVHRVGRGAAYDGGPEGPGDVGPREFRHLAAALEEARLRLGEAGTRERRLEDSRRELVSWVSHDLRTPLAGLRAMVEALDDGLVDDPAHLHRQLRADVDRMTGMVDDLVELSRLHTATLPVHRERLALADLVREAVAVAGPLARARGVRLGGTVEPGVEVLADPAGFSRVVTDLVLNAVRHTAADGVVEVHGRAVATGVELSVSDACGGIAAHDLSRLFGSADPARGTRTPPDDGDDGDGGDGERADGSGLAAVRGIVEAHAGRIDVENVDSGVGCRVLVSLPDAGVPVA